MKKLAFITFLLIGAISMIVMSYHYFSTDGSGILRTKQIADSLWYLLAFKTHISLGLLAILTGPFQFLKKVRKTSLVLHKTIGYIYVTCVCLSSITGFIIAQYAMGGPITSVGFSILSFFWLFTTLRAFLLIYKGDINGHKKWMFLSYSLTFAAITQRTLLLIPLLTTVAFMPIYQLSAWLPWLLNLGIAYLLFQRS